MAKSSDFPFFDQNPNLENIKQIKVIIYLNKTDLELSES